MCSQENTVRKCTASLICTIFLWKQEKQYKDKNE